MLWLKKIYHALLHPQRMALLDYAVQPSPVYSTARPHRLLLQQIEQSKEQYRQLLHHVLHYKEYFLSIPVTANEQDLQPAWNNGFLPGLDMVLLYTLLSTIQPKKYIEIGSGTSTKVALKARAEQGLQYSITCIDPQPRTPIAAVADDWYNTTVQQVPLPVFESLEENDVLFFDGSHLLHAGSDVQWFFMEIIPLLKKGVLVQVHDVYLPYDYPQQMCDRFYAEQYMLATMLLSNPERFEIIAPAFYMSEEKEWQHLLSPLWKQLTSVEQHGGSFWLKMK